MARRLTAILAADVVGFSRLMEADEAGTLAGLKAHRTELVDPLIEHHDGRTVKLMGDGALVEFPSVVEAVSCAIAVQQGMRERNADIAAEQRIVFRIGVNLGDVMIDGDDIYGDGVNVAARLEALAEPGGICISGPVHESIVGRVEQAFADDGEQTVKNLSRPVRVWRWLEDAAGAEPAAGKAPSSRLRDKPSVAVLPFTNMSGDPQQEYFSDGITEDIITELSRFRSLSVIARSSSFVFKGQAIDVKDAGERLGVAYIVEGSVRTAGNRVRVTAQLVEATTGNHLWADRYDRDMEDLFAIQDDVTRRIVNNLASHVATEDLELAKRREPKDWRAYDCWLQGRELGERWTPDDDQAAKIFFEKAIDIDPGFARAHAELAGVYEMTLTFHPGHPDAIQDLQRAYDYAERAITLDDTDARPHVSLAWILMFRREFDLAARHIDRAAALNPNDADVLINLAIILGHLGRVAEALRAGEDALQLNPHHPDSYSIKMGVVFLLSERYRDAVAAFRTVRAPVPGVAALEAAALAHLGELDEARERAEGFIATMKQAWSGDPDASVADYLDWLKLWLPMRRSEDNERLVDGLKMAGLPA